MNPSTGLPNNGFQQKSWEILGQNGEQVSETDGAGNWAHTNVYAGGRLIATYDTAGLHFQLSDWLGTRRVETDYAGNTQETCTNLPFGDGAPNCTSPTEQFFTGYARDTETGNDYAQARYYASGMGRFLTPDPYDGSYDINNPQSFDRYAYVNANPLGFVDPSGLAGGVTGWGGVCKIGKSIDGQAFQPFGGFNPCNPVVSVIAYGIAYSADSIDAGINSIFDSGLSTNVDASAAQVAMIAGYVNAALTIACSIDNFNSAMCGSSGWTRVFGKSEVGEDVGKAVNDGIAVYGAYLCATGPGSPECLGYAIYSVVNAIISWVWGNDSGPKFTGSLLPRPGVPGMQGSSSFGVPVHNLRIRNISGNSSSGAIPTPGP